MTTVNRDDLALFLGAFHQQLDASGSILDALAAAEPMLTGTPFGDVATSVRDGVSEGKSVFGAIYAGPVPFPETVLLLVEVAEEVGSSKVLSLLLNAAAGRVSDGTIPMPGDAPDTDRKAGMVRFWRLLATIIDCGVPLLRGLRTLQREPLGDELCTCCDRICASVEKGECFSDALRELPDTFSPSVCVMVQAGESGGVMDVAAARIAEGLNAGTLSIPGIVDPAQWAPLPHLPWRSLALMLSTGVPCLLAIEVLDEETQDGHGEVLAGIADHTRAGDTLSEALRRCGQLSPDLCDVVAKGEEDGSLDAALVELADALDRGEFDVTKPEPEAVDGGGKSQSTPKPVAQAVRLVDVIIYQAVKDGASDVHFEPGEDSMTVRYRIDGMLYEMQPPPAEMRRAVVNRLKVLGDLNVAERRLPQDGRIEMRIGGRRVDLRISTVPTVHGERVVLRVFDRVRGDIPLDRIGFSRQDLVQVRELCAMSHGLIVVTGPAGTGRTTLLYAMVSELRSSERAILTVEDPVERPLAGVAQVPVRGAIGLTFPRALVSVLRQAPNVIMVGEIRDQETLQIAAQSALSGHLVLAGMPGDTAAQTLRRMLDLGLEPRLLNAALGAVIALRLPRLLCPECRVPCTPDPTGLPAAAANIVADDAKTAGFHTTRGCPACGNSGYHGRTAICEILTPDDALCRALADDANARELHAVAIASGMHSLLEDGLEKARTGVTSIDEIMRVAPADHTRQTKA
ncbi:MAG: Flp pilus assembly complex ATPase component TadA [Lentisphaerae bacterium]|jgi:general secretion pathway protein E|nr:Flp pilus assembly complex ATPase component TadA [Lentisphaerota bacterium]MBT4816715.1 Flp pilus assembly complex ATPase component TadA [Lentisphaerota bacterium]MBT5607844.1 Flp pilus assembly complex ATPase component TadA [Lentisphaerota bacterium]MBT7054826.1 Flp pilus assembly complex ATPase component TadA [Lentisphaerota bacterium]MBT7845566.1 Flp pilus assembly complex ATPase component TadA [Lentisphaerota bacterium]